MNVISSSTVLGVSCGYLLTLRILSRCMLLRKHIGILGAVRIADGTLVAERAETFDADTFQGFLNVFSEDIVRAAKWLLL